eukprot:5862391-Pyramimonas_sp.AAC.1
MRALSNPDQSLRNSCAAPRSSCTSYAVLIRPRARPIQPRSDRMAFLTPPVSSYALPMPYLP